jgi:hypothetical protein
MGELSSRLPDGRDITVLNVYPLNEGTQVLVCRWESYIVKDGKTIAVISADEYFTARNAIWYGSYEEWKERLASGRSQGELDYQAEREREHPITGTEFGRTTPVTS